ASINGASAATGVCAKVRGMRYGLTPIVAAAICIVGPAGANAQERITVAADVVLYGDNTEFRNPYREGETLFGTTVRVAGNIELNPRVRLELGAHGHVRFGSADAFESARPV